MKKAQATKLFEQVFFGTDSFGLQEDRAAVQYAWQLFIDALCKNGEITQEQYNSWTFPWKRKL